MSSDLKTALIIVAIIVIVFVALFAAKGFGSTESAVGHFLKDTLQGTSLEQPSAAIESAGNDLTSKANGAIALFSGLLIIGGFLWIGSKT